MIDQVQPIMSAEVKKPEELVISMKEELSRWPRLSESHCIYRVPPHLRKDESLYTPRIVTVGPIHHGRSEGLKANEEYKQRFLIDFLQRTSVEIEDYARFVRVREERLRECYMDTIYLTSDELTKIFMVDAAFLVELLLKNSDDLYDDSCRIFGRPRMLWDIMTDLMLLENQLPMFILEDIFDSWIKVLDDGNYSETDIISLVGGLIDRGSDIIIPRGYVLENVGSSKPVHILDCLRICYISTGLGNPPEREPEEVENPYVRSATELHQAGLKFKRSPCPNLFSIEFKGRVLLVPYMAIGSASKRIYSNLLAFEQCHFPKMKLLTDFFCLMDQLVNAPQDIDLLVESGVLKHALGDSSEAANVFNGISQGLTRSARKNHFAGVYRGLTMYYERPWNRWKATLKQKYFNTPWAIISVVAASVLLILTFTQTVFSVIK